MGYSRRVLHYGPGPTDFRSEISDRAIAGCWFELHRQGGCGAGELRLNDTFPSRNEIEIGDWIALEFATGDRWYLGRVEQRRATSPAEVTFRLQGMSVELGEVFPGGFGPNRADGVPPHRYARTDLFSHDPDYSLETVDSVSRIEQFVELLLQQYVTPRTHITVDPANVEDFPAADPLTSLKFRGEESVRSILKEQAVRAFNASWGVDENGAFFFLQKRTALLATIREGRDTITLEESRDRELLFNRVILTGGYVYNERIASDISFRGFYRWRGNYIQPASRDQHGERRIRIWVPWIRTQEDSRQFVTEFFRIYSQPTNRYLVEVGNRPALLRPWQGRIRLEAADGSELLTGMVETIRVQFDHAPRFRMEVGPEDPHTHFPEPPHDERWEVPGAMGEGGGSELSFSSIEEPSSDVSSELTSESSPPSDATSDPPLSSGETGASTDASQLTSSDITSSNATSSDATSSDVSSTGATSSGFTSSGATSSGATSSDATSSDATSSDVASSDGTSGISSSGLTSSGMSSSDGTSSEIASSGVTSSEGQSSGVSSSGLTSSDITSSAITSSDITSSDVTSSSSS